MFDWILNTPLFWVLYKYLPFISFLMEQRVLFVRSVKVLGLFKHLFICTKLLILILLHNIYVALPGFCKIMLIHKFILGIIMKP